ncbi:MAG: TIGR03435 family protein [Candidatus Acidiferrales bacterium]
MKFRKRLLLYSALLVVVLGVVSAPVGSQTPPLAKLAFDVVSIKPSTAGTRTQLKVEPGGRFVADGVPLALLVAIAYHLQAYQMVGADGWLMNDHWSVEAKTADGTVDPPSANPPYMGVPDRMVLRLQSLLADRFDLKTHREMHEMQVYDLTVAAAGPDLKPTDAPSQSAPGKTAARGAQPRLTPEGKLPVDFAPPPGAVVAGPGIIAASAISMDQIIVLLNRVMNYPVTDKTGLTGYFNVRLQFDPASTPRAMGAPPSPADPNAAPPPSDDPSIFVAVEQQLGLKLKLAKEPVQVLVIDSAQRPTPN